MIMKMMMKIIMLAPDKVQLEKPLRRAFFGIAKRLPLGVLRVTLVPSDRS
jgi:hypothetical protein